MAQTTTALQPLLPSSDDEAAQGSRSVTKSPFVKIVFSGVLAMLGPLALVGALQPTSANSKLCSRDSPCLYSSLFGQGMLPATPFRVHPIYGAHSVSLLTGSGSCEDVSPEKMETMCIVEASKLKEGFQFGWIGTLFVLSIISWGFTMILHDCHVVESGNSSAMQTKQTDYGYFSTMSLGCAAVLSVLWATQFAGVFHVPINHSCGCYYRAHDLAALMILGIPFSIMLRFRAASTDFVRSCINGPYIMTQTFHVPYARYGYVANGSILLPQPWQSDPVWQNPDMFELDKYMLQDEMSPALRKRLCRDLSRHHCQVLSDLTHGYLTRDSVARTKKATSSSLRFGVCFGYVIFAWNCAGFVFAVRLVQTISSTFVGTTVSLRMAQVVGVLSMIIFTGLDVFLLLSMIKNIPFIVKLRTNYSMFDAPFLFATSLMNKVWPLGRLIYALKLGLKYCDIDIHARDFTPTWGEVDDGRQRDARPLLQAARMCQEFEWSAVLLTAKEYYREDESVVDDAVRDT